MHRFAGSTVIASKEAVEQELGRKLPDDFVAKAPVAGPHLAGISGKASTLKRARQS